MAADAFTAWAMCPQCRKVDCHWIREPNPESVGSGDEVRVEAFGGFTVRSFTLGAMDETAFEVIRTCTGCGMEFGQV
ncbi:hypothetical protein [Nocardia wallacei]|uniref:hypothetical protein n=1 Tax=Nocardia wallacei TaxID=480035 RepID=UPI002456C942|nr:hypothetical protein [Nocardia wallacei]